MLNKFDPTTELFDVINDGYVPIVDLGAICSFEGIVDYANFGPPANKSMMTNMLLSNATHIDNHFADYLAHEGRATVPCFSMVGRLNLNNVQMHSGVVMRVTINYAFYGLNWPILRRGQQFRFRSVVGADNQHHWISLK